ncbi:MAG: dephospho-CoA kinase, partial [Burkholderiales bacterium]|nr:dephospho-CoA kinase [Burkholderiales bacterium]
VHPLARQAQRRFLAAAAMRRCPVAVLDIPLLFETGGDRRCDAVIVVSAPAFIQRHRVMRRPGMTPDKLALLLGRQMPDGEKRRRADFVIETGRGYREALIELRRILAVLGWKTGKRPTRKLRRGTRRR